MESTLQKELKSNMTKETKSFTIVMATIYTAFPKKPATGKWMYNTTAISPKQIYKDLGKEHIWCIIVLNMWSNWETTSFSFLSSFIRLIFPTQHFRENDRKNVSKNIVKLKSQTAPNKLTLVSQLSIHNKDFTHCTVSFSQVDNLEVDLPFYL